MDIIIIEEKFSGSIESQLEQALLELKKRSKEQNIKFKNIVKVNIFLRELGNEDFTEAREKAGELVKSIFKDSVPAFTVICQPPLSGNDILIEGHFLESGKDAKIERREFYKHPYVVVSMDKGKYREMYTGGITTDKGENLIYDTQKSFDFAEQLLMKEDMTFGNVVRQWNYIPSILDFQNMGGTRLQHYQIFNDIRALYFEAGQFKNGYPAATGIGSSCGSVTIDIIAVDAQENYPVTPIKNPGQQNAYSYSEKVLEGEALSSESGKKPPLFERGKAVSTPNENNIYISGTASIKGEKTVAENDVSEQTRITIENIEELTTKDNLKDAGVDLNGDTHEYKYVRVYVTKKDDLPAVKRVVEEKMKAGTAVYVLADICRNNLLVEIEADIITSK